jgi:hypothetical protein
MPIILPLAVADDGLVHEAFSKDPGWEGKTNIPDSSVCVSKTQDFGYSRTRHAGGAIGEIGGNVFRSLTPATYAKWIRPRTLNDSLHASGKFTVTHSEGGSSAIFGWFNHESRGWRTPNSLVFRIDGEAGKFRVFFEYGTQTLKTGGGTTFEGRYQTTKTPMHLADGTSHAWSLDYDPNADEGHGEITFSLDDKIYKAPLAAGHKGEGATFDRFGIMNMQTSGDTMTLWLDDLVIDGQREDFALDPGWEGRGNQATFTDCGIRPHHDFGYRRSNHAGGEPGEVGGLMWRIESFHPENAGYYADPIGLLSLDDELTASGRVAFRGAASDSGILFGWFNSRTAIGAPPANFLGLFIEGLSRVGHYVRPAFGTSDDIKDVLTAGPVIRPDRTTHRWSLKYSPSANQGRGQITMTFDEQSVSMDLTAAARKGNAIFDRFGFLSWHRGGNYVDIYFDDITYTARRPSPQ